MFEAQVYQNRRQQLKEKVGSGLIILMGNGDSPMNYTDNIFPFRQDSSFLYFFGLDRPDLIGVIDIDSGSETILGTDITVTDIIWMGPQPSLAEMAAKVGITSTDAPGALGNILNKASLSGGRIHLLPPYRGDNILKLEKLGVNARDKKNISVDLIKAVVDLREIKSDEEIAEMERALEISHEMFDQVMTHANPGVTERELVGRIEKVVESHGCQVAYPIILTIRGEILHNHHHDKVLKENDLLLVDAGSESLMHYASDITRTYPIGGKFTPLQKEVYEIVLNAQLDAIDMVKPGVFHRDVHLHSCKILAEGLKSLGLMKGDVDEAVAAGAHALFFQCGYGHQIGLDVHDMEDLGEEYVGYTDTFLKSTQFGLRYLRMGKELKPGHVLTGEPGLYFIPELIDQWKAENNLSQFINYDEVEKFRSFGGIRVEDDILVTESGFRVLGKPIPKTVEEIETGMQSAQLTTV